MKNEKSILDGYYPIIISVLTIIVTLAVVCPEVFSSKRPIVIKERGYDKDKIIPAKIKKNEPVNKNIVVNEDVVEVDKTKTTIIEKDGLKIKKDYRGEIIYIMEDVHFLKGEAYYSILKENTKVGNVYEHVENINFNGTIVEGYMDYGKQRRAFKFEINGLYGYVYVDKQWAYDSQEIVYKAIRTAKKFNNYK